MFSNHIVAMLIKQVSMKYMERSAPYAFMSIENSF